MDIFVTGSTGLLGSHLIDALSKDKNIDRIYALVRNSKKPTLRDNSKVTLLNGNITSRNLGLKKEEIQNLKNIQEIYHLAALVSLSNKKENKSLIYDVNVKGTKHLLDLFKKNKNLKKLFYVSSAYSCGYYSKEVPEDWLIRPKEFRNFYESTKFDAEQLIKEYSVKYQIPYIILRPSILLSDLPEDFDKISNHSIYLYGKILCQILKEIEFNPIKIKLIGNKSSTLNFILVRDLINFFVLIRNTEINNSIFNIVNSQNTSMGGLLQSIEKGLNYNGEFTLANSLENPNKVELAVSKLTSSFSKYTMNKPIIWNNKKTLNFTDKITNIDNVWIKKHIEEYLKRVSADEK